MGRVNLAVAANLDQNGAARPEELHDSLQKPVEVLMDRQRRRARELGGQLRHHQLESHLLCGLPLGASRAVVERSVLRLQVEHPRP